MTTFVTVFHIFICFILVIVVLMQSGKDGGIGVMGGGSSQTVFGSTGGADFFTKFTSALAAVFMVTSILLTVNKSGRKASVFDNAKPVSSATQMPQKAPAPAPAAPSAATPGKK